MYHQKLEELKMKRIISIILALALVAAMLPTFAFAAEGEAEGIRIKYDLLGAVKKLGVSWEASSTESSALKRVPFTRIDFELSDGFFNFKNSSNGIFTGHSEINYNPAYGFQISKSDWIEFDIFVPKAGTYTMEMWCGNYSADTKTSVYINGTEVGKFSNYEKTVFREHLRKVRSNSLRRLLTSRDMSKESGLKMQVFIL